MTLALHGKSRNRQWLLAMFGLVAIIAAIGMALGALKSARADDTIDWTGQGVTNGELNTEICDPSTNTPYLQWNFTTGGGSNITDATLTVNADTYEDYTETGGVIKFITPYYDLNTVTASVAYVGTLGSGNTNLTISHGCPGGEPPQATITVAKTADTSFTRTCVWDIEKTSETTQVVLEKGDSVDVDYEVTVTVDCTDSDFVVSGTVTVTNPGDEDANVSAIWDELNGVEIDLECDTDLPAVLAAGESIECTYSETSDGVDGTNIAYATETFDGFPDDTVDSDAVDVTFDDPTTTVNGCVTVEDDKYGVLDEELCYGDVPEEGEVYKYSLTIEAGDESCTSSTFTNTATVTVTSNDDDGGELASDDHDVAVLVYCDDTAWASRGAGLDRYNSRGNWATWVSYANVFKTVSLFAGQTNLAGTVTLSAVSGGNVTITVTLNDDYFFASGDSLKVQGYATQPNGNPSPGGFANKTTCPDIGETKVCTIVVAAANYYGIHVDVLSLP